ncbi:Non-reducing polyketide synthase terA [Pseudocercospora fuligena]|uniref:Non-reducing polyketide synthase terA n=1 Tax=Pseudocercospora fuligena TaxID=685502 RepID=A0A8H6RMF1_9PEZI|nr:Non-reducing polyketide synthase terA [Pseudocercospora fuligena]
MASDERLQQGLQIVGEAINVEPDDFQDHETWKFLGLGDMLAAATASDLNNAGIPVPIDVFTKCPTVGDFKAFLIGEVNEAENGVEDTAASTSLEPADPWEGVPKPKVPLSVVLQGQPSNASTVVFLLPDGSGAGTSYGTLPPIGSNICLIGLNSPFLRQAENFTCSIERMARLWVDEIRKYQPKGGPYTLGGWSAGGYYSFEVTKLLTAAGEKVERLILIDSPCRLRYEALPAQVVAELTKKGLMGASGAKKAPEWLVQHFTSTVLSVEKYTPVPLPHNKVPPKVNFIWVKEGLVKSVPESGLDVDMSVKVTRFLLEPRPNLQSEGWETLLPGATFTFDYMTGNHFQITQPPHSDSLGHVLSKVLSQ